MEASRVICTNCIVIVVPKTFKELISIVLEVRSIVVMICRYECFIGGSYNTIINQFPRYRYIIPGSNLF